MYYPLTIIAVCIIFLHYFLPIKDALYDKFAWLQSLYWERAFLSFDCLYLFLLLNRFPLHLHNVDRVEDLVFVGLSMCFGSLELHPFNDFFLAHLVQLFILFFLHEIGIILIDWSADGGRWSHVFWDLPTTLFVDDTDTPHYFYYK